MIIMILRHNVRFMFCRTTFRVIAGWYLESKSHFLYALFWVSKNAWEWSDQTICLNELSLQLCSRRVQWIFWWGSKPSPTNHLTVPHPDILWVYQKVSGEFNDIHTLPHFLLHFEAKFKDIQYLMHLEKNVCVP